MLRPVSNWSKKSSFWKSLIVNGNEQESRKKSTRGSVPAGSMPSDWVVQIIMGPVNFRKIVANLLKGIHGKSKSLRKSPRASSAPTNKGRQRSKPLPLSKNRCRSDQAG